MPLKVETNGGQYQDIANSLDFPYPSTQEKNPASGLASAKLFRVDVEVNVEVESKFPSSHWSN